MSESLRDRVAPDEHESCFCQNGGGIRASGGPCEHMHAPRLGCPEEPTPNPTS